MEELIRMSQITISSKLVAIGQQARQSGNYLKQVNTSVKNAALGNIAKYLETESETVILANNKDLENGRRLGVPETTLDRLILDRDRLKDMAQGVMAIVELGDPVGMEFDNRILANGLIVSKRCVPLGVIGSIYESRPNVTIDIASLCLKSGNACILRGGSEALESNSALCALIQKALQDSGIPKEAVQFIDDQDRNIVNQMLTMDDYIDLLIPRGGASLVKFVAQHATMPTVSGGIGVCHIYVDHQFNLGEVIPIVLNAKTQRPSVCNALDTLLVHSTAAPLLLPELAKQLTNSNVELRCDIRALSLLGPNPTTNVKAADLTDWGKEFLGLTLAIKVVNSFDSAISHIQNFGSGHSECIITSIPQNGDKFLREIDASVVFLNSSTRFNDGSELGLGAEVAISTNKIHVYKLLAFTVLSHWFREALDPPSFSL